MGPRVRGVDDEHDFPFSRRLAPEVCNYVRPQKKEDAARPSREGAGNAGCPMHPWPHKMRVVFHRFTGLNRHSLRDGFTAYFVLSPATGFVVTVAAWTLPRGLNAS